MTAIILTCLLACLGSSPAHAFYMHENNALYTEARGLITAAGSTLDGQRVDTVSARLMLDADMPAWHFEYHQIWQQSLHAIQQYRTEADRLNITYSNETTQIKLGRQAISLTTTFFFSPNDFFAPFTIQSLNRDYKPGVDALSVEQQTGELSMLSLIAVNNHEEALPTSSILQFDSVWKNISWRLLAAEIYIPGRAMAAERQQITGGHIQFDMESGLTFRGEGHLGQTGDQSYHEWVAGLEYPIHTDILLRGEYFYHGAHRPLPYLPYTGQRYLALGAFYQLTPLLFGQFTVTRQQSDASMLASIYLNYSLSNESTANLSVVMPSGTAGSEFRLYPKLLSLDYQLYF